MKTISTVEARDNFAETINKVSYCKERIILTRRDKPIVAIISMEDLVLPESLKEDK